MRNAAIFALPFLLAVSSVDVSQAGGVPGDAQVCDCMILTNRRACIGYWQIGAGNPFGLCSDHLCDSSTQPPKCKKEDLRWKFRAFEDEWDMLRDQWEVTDNRGDQVRKIRQIKPFVCESERSCKGCDVVMSGDGVDGVYCVTVEVNSMVISQYAVCRKEDGSLAKCPATVDPPL